MSTAAKALRAARLLPALSLFLFFCLSESPATLLAALSALLFHEAGHLFFFLLSDTGLPRFTVDTVGLRLTPTQEPTAAASVGILGGGALFNLLGSFIFYRIGLTDVGAMHLSAAAFNLLPIGTSDGGNLFGLLCRALLPARVARAVSEGVSLLLLAAIFFFGLLCFYFSGQGLSAAFFALFFFFSCFGGYFEDL